MTTLVSHAHIMYHLGTPFITHMSCNTSSLNLKHYIAIRLTALPCSLNVNSLRPKDSGMSALIIGNTIRSDCSPAITPFYLPFLLVQAQ